MASLRAATGLPFSPRPACCRLPSSPGSGHGFVFPPRFAPGVFLFFPLDSAGGSGVAHRRAYPRIEATARHGARKENPKVRNHRLQKKFNGTATKPRLSVFCSNRQLYAMLVDDHNKKILFYGSTLQKAICGDPPCGAVEAAGRIGEELIRACKELDITEISSYDRNGFARGEKMMAFEVPDLVELECIDWARKEINIKYEIRDNRKGYKAGALKKGMEHIYTQQCDFVAIFDADFQPESDFLLKIIPFLVHNPKIGLVQTRWEFVNYDVCLMTRIQKMSLDYHFKVEQESGSSMHSFFGFNGTAAVWRVSATINEAGGWKDHTTVEDMDLAVRLYGQASRDGNSCMLVKSELPSTFKAYRHRQHRWTCGTANLFRKMQRKLPKTRQAFFNMTEWNMLQDCHAISFFTRLYVIQGVSVWKKLHLLYSFFFVRRVVAPILTFLFYRVVIPLSVMVPEVSIPVWGMVCIPTAITIMNAIRNPGSLHLMPFWILFENVMAMHRMRAALTGLFETMNVNQWVVTEKVGDHVKDKLEVPLLEPLKPTDCVERIYIPELVVAAKVAGAVTVAGAALRWHGERARVAGSARRGPSHSHLVASEDRGRRIRAPLSLPRTGGGGFVRRHPCPYTLPFPTAWGYGGGAVVTQGCATESGGRTDDIGGSGWRADGSRGVPR
uniref:glucomannan 4-beta-mannosyltransferase n=1 Tax=Oryza nivara TaxID=4536 RepID=A0A0E0IKB3_ORYNI